MKKTYILCFYLCFSLTSFSQGLWTEKANFPLSINTSISFTIQSVGYVYTGDSAHNFYAYDPTANTWMPKADLPGSARYTAVGFSIDSFGYIGTGLIHGVRVNDFYQYNPSTNTWSSIASFPDSTNAAYAFSINQLGYVISGDHDTAGYRCFAYHPSSNQWLRIASVPHYSFNCFAISANSKGYFLMSYDSVYEYNPLADSWASLGASQTFNTCGFGINSKIYVCGQTSGYGIHANMNVFDLQTHLWSTIGVFPYNPAQCGSLIEYVGMTIDNKGYLGGRNSCLSNEFWQYDTAHHFTLSTLSPDTICQNDSFSVSISSDLAFGSTNQFYAKVSDNNSNIVIYSDSITASSIGTYSFKLPLNTFLPRSVNSTNIEVFSTDPPSETDYYTTAFIVNKGPANYFPLAMSNTSCGGSALLLYRSNAQGNLYSWTSSPSGVNDSTYFLSFTPTLPVTKIYNSITNAITGCSIKDSTVVYLFSNPVLNISDSIFNICIGTPTTLGGTVTAGCSYTWTGSSTSSSSNPVVSPLTSGIYHVLVEDTVTKCSVKGTTTVTVKQAPAQTICYVTVDSASTHNIIIWEKLDKYATDSFYIYRETSTNNYTKIAAVHRDSLSEYHDYAANPNVTGYRYKISAEDTCSNESTRSPYHNTIHLQYLGGGNLIWNVYEIENNSVTPVLSFDVYRDSLANGDWQIMVNIPGNQYTATDVNFSQHPNARYRIVANWSYSCTPARSANNMVLSNVIQLSPNGINTIESTETISLYPNPAKDQLMINCGNMQVQEISIYSAEGKLIYISTMPSNNQLDISYIPEGMYIAEVKVANIIHRIKWVKI